MSKKCLPLRHFLVFDSVELTIWRKRDIMKVGVGDFVLKISRFSLVF